MNRQQWHLLERWLGMIPAKILGREPLLLLLKALSWAYRYHYSESWKLVGEAEPLVAAVPPESAAGRRLRGFLAYWRCQKCYVTGEMEQAVASGDRALELLPAAAADLRGNAVGLLALSLWAQGDSERAERTLHDVHAEAGGALRTRVLLGLGVLRWMAGDLGGFERVAAGLHELGEELDLRDTREWAACYLGAIHYQRGDLETSERYLTAATGKPFRTRTLIRLHATAGLALCRLAQGRETEAGELAESLIEYMLKISNPAGLAIARAFQAEIALRRGATAEALAWARTYDPEPILPMWFPYMPQLTLARVWIAGGEGRNYYRAEQLLARLRDFATRTHTTPCQIEGLAVQALLHQARGEEPAARLALAKAVALALPGGFLRLFVDLGPRLRELLESLELDDEGSRYVGRILAAYPAKAGEDPAPTPRVDPIEPHGVKPHGVEPLTGRERDVLAGLARRLSDKEIAAELGVSSSTVKTHAHKVYVKLGVSGRRQAVARANALGILTVTEG